MANVEFHKIAKNYGAVNVLKDLDLSVADREFVVLLGSSGCGKTTLLRMIAGLETVTSGDISIDGKRVNDVHPRDRDIAMVFQNYALYPTMNVFDNIAFSMVVAKRSRDEIQRKVAEAAEVLGLSELLDRKPGELSGGQRQRVAMGRAMVRDAKVFLFDEPLSNLDAKLRAHMRVEIRLLHERLGATTIYVTHDQIEAMTMADKIVLMQAGRIIQVGTPDDLYDRPNAKFVADFIGSPAMNFIDGQIVRGDGKAMFRAEQFELELGPEFSRAEHGQQVICGIRPSDLAIDPDGAIQGEVQLAEKTGADIQLHMSLQGREFVAVVERHTNVKANQTVSLSVAPQQVHIFDATTEQRLGG